MKIENRIEGKDEHSHRIEILNKNSNLALLAEDPWIDAIKMILILLFCF